MNAGPAGPAGSLCKRLLWMAAIWLAGVLVLGAVAALIRFAMARSF